MAAPKGKMNIHAFFDDLQLKELPGSPYVVQLNPSVYTQDYKIEFASEQAAGSSGKSQVYHFHEPDKLSFEFLFDATGAIKSARQITDAKSEGIYQEIERFKSFVYRYHGDIHRPNFLRLIWGRLIFDCVLESMSVEFTLFNEGGIPLRANVKATFQETIEEEIRVKEEDPKSPDVTHYHQVQAGDKLFNLTDEIYGDSLEYWRVVGQNQLINFRNLKIGQEIIFPTIEKTTNS